MMMRLTLCTTVFCALFSFSLNAQIGVGQWRDHLPYTNAIDVAQGNGQVFTATESAIAAYSKTDHSVRRISKVNELTASGISAIGFSEEYNTLVVAYENGNLDLLTNGTGRNMADILNSSILGDKSISDIYFIDNRAYLATGFGIVVINIEAQEVADTYIIGPNASQLKIYSITSDGENLFAVTENAVYKGSLGDPFLANYQNWDQINDLPPIGNNARFAQLINYNGNFYLRVENENEDVVYTSTTAEPLQWEVLQDLQDTPIYDISVGKNDNVYIVEDNDVYVFDESGTFLEEVNNLNGENGAPKAIVVDEEDIFWMADSNKGLVSTNQQFEFRDEIAPDGPAYKNVRRLDAYNDNIWVASGGVDQSWVPNYDKFGAYGFVDEEWIHFSAWTVNENDLEATNDIMDIAVNPQNNSEVFISSYEEGLVRLVDGVGQDVYRNDNSTLVINDNDEDPQRVMLTGLSFDQNNNLWIGNNYSNLPIHVRTAGGEFIGYDFGNTVTENSTIDRVTATSGNLVWGTLPRGGGLLVFNHNGTLANTSDDNFKLLNNEEGNGGLPSNDVYCVEEDLDGEVWVGTLRGLGVFYSPQAIFSEEGADVQQILIEQDGNVQVLLETEAINCITIDGANRKWIGTESSGAFLLSPDGTDQIYHFTEENSPLLSNNIFDIDINYEKGEVFFATEDGIISFLSTSSNFDQEMTELKVYPNPVRETFDGPIRIDGLDYNTDVKITDISGNVVYQTTSNGGRAIWNGKDFNGNRVATGVYLIFATNTDGSATNVGKIAFVQ
ncbi:type IX secretion system anionic LPS delivery protein PorZ [Halocola ammonii]